MACCDQCGRDDCCGAEMQNLISELKGRIIELHNEKKELEAELYEKNCQTEGGL